MKRGRSERKFTDVVGVEMLTVGKTGEDAGDRR